jgi:hypothetical protein
MQLEQSEKQLTQEELDNFEENFQVSLPDDFRQYYLDYNGGYLPYDYVKGLKNIFTINGFDSIKYGSLPIEQIIADNKKSGITFKKSSVCIR